MAYRLEAFDPRQRDDYLHLLRAAWGSRSLSPDEFDWWFERNPAGSLRSVAHSDGRVVGVAGHSFLRMVISGEERLATFSVQATTAAAARGQGIFAALERRHEDEAKAVGAAVVLAFASKPTAPIFLGPLGWTRIGRLRIWARPLPAVLRPRASLARAERFDHAGDAAAGWPNHVVRDAAYLSWRYLDSPKRYAVFRDGAGYAVLGHKVQRGRQIAYVADLVAADPRRLLSACLAAVRAGSVAVFALPAPGHRRAYAAAGFVPTIFSLDLMGKALAEPLDVDSASWRFTLGDTDFF
jgi:GNAT superfamily N-acetyltransferase